MDQQGYEQALLQPSIPSSSLPVNLTVFHGGTSPPSTTHAECYSGDIYIGLRDIYIFCDGKWEIWVLTNPFRLDLYGDILYVVPCGRQGIQLISSTDMDGSFPDKTSECLHTVGIEPMTSSDIIQLIVQLLWNAEETSNDIEMGKVGVEEGPSTIVLKPMGIVVGKSGHKQKPDMGPKRMENIGCSKKEGKEKKKEKESSRDIQVSGEDQPTSNEPKCSRTATEEEDIGIPSQPLLDGISCPAKAPLVEWKRLGITTYALWFGPMDKKAVEYMAGAEHAQEYPHMIKESLSRGCVVLVHSWEPSPLLSFMEEDIGMYRPKSVQESWGSRTVTIKEFIDLATKQKECLNLLDLPNTQPDILIFLRPLSDNVNARLLTMNDCHLPRDGLNKEKEFYGMQTMHGDAKRLCGWDLMMHGGFLTYPYHDAGGLWTKVWGYFNMVPGFTATRWALFEAWDDILLPDQEMNFKKHSLGVVLLGKGDMLIQPPGAPHMVYMPQNCLASGGHLSYLTMHLMEVSLIYDCSMCPGEDEEHGLVVMNAAHPFLHRYIIWMILVLPKFASDEANVQKDMMALEVNAEMENAN
ncbi:hypothetical protein EDD17DRAFT_1514088 [Pisolithus thermaeus]|nr:hypothetical protein EV401DRAFT_1887501 [Pisolithus croceorrhizus]KAI6148995.1 hypothetical protein EDD17DRAFT_1514088 [Pisolithus thermaeus]